MSNVTLDVFFNELSRAISESRSALIEEAWFGRHGAIERNAPMDWLTTPAGKDLPEPERVPFEEAWAPRKSIEPEPASPHQYELDLDR